MKLDKNYLAIYSIIPFMICSYFLQHFIKDVDSKWYFYFVCESAIPLILVFALGTFVPNKYKLLIWGLKVIFIIELLVRLANLGDVGNWSGYLLVGVYFLVGLIVFKK